MTFFNTGFAAEFLLLAVLYYNVRNGTAQLYILLAFSIFFYMTQDGAALPLLVFVCAVTSFASFPLLRAALSRHSSLIVVSAGIAIDMMVLFFFKYAGFAAGTLDPGFAGRHEWYTPFLLLPLPVGISFYVFHGVSLLADSYSGAYKPARQRGLREHVERTLLYLVFFPQLIAGPISKARMFMPQIEAKRFGDIDWSFAVQQLIFGYFCKLAIANNLADWTIRADPAYIAGFGTPDLLVLQFGYTIQIFADFAGYSSIAIGLAALLGYRLPQNFNFPYIAESFSEFWRRWHMSLSSWLRDYLYIPLGGNRKGRIRTYVNLMVVMGLGGLWHGASWNFAIWGLLHGGALSVERMFGGNRTGPSERWSIAVPLRIALVFFFVFLFWIPFRYKHFSDTVLFFETLYRNRTLHADPVQLFTVALLSTPIVAFHLHALASERSKIRLSPNARALIFGTMAFLALSNAGVGTPFIYFQF